MKGVCGSPSGSAGQWCEFPVCNSGSAGLGCAWSVVLHLQSVHEHFLGEPVATASPCMWLIRTVSSDPCVGGCFRLRAQG